MLSLWVDYAYVNGRHDYARVISKKMYNGNPEEAIATFGPSGRQLRLNCWAKKRRQKVRSHLRMVASSYFWPNA